MKVFCISLVALIALSGCSLQSASSSESLFGSLIGAGLGTASGLILAEEDAKYDGTNSALLGAGVGSALGLLAGGLAYDSGTFAPPPKPPLRLPVVGTNEIQYDIDNLRYDYDESQKWGRGETKPWDERIYDNSNYPYEGVATGTGF